MYAKKLSEELTPRPYIYDVAKFFIGGSGISYGKSNNIGIFDFEVPIGGGEGSLNVGDINECAKIDMVHPLNETEMTDKKYERLKKNGGFYLEKYVDCRPKADVGIPNTNNINGIISITELKEFLQTNSSLYSPDSNISDYFGNAVLAEEGEEYNGTIGIKFGVRLCYIPPAEFADIGGTSTQEARKDRSFNLTPARFLTESGMKTLGSSRHTFPIASYDLDILDVKMEDLLSSNDNLNQDLGCYIDKLVETKNFKHLFENILDIKKVPSLYMIYSYVNFLTSLGTEEERDFEDPAIGSIGDMSKTFGDTKSAARALFAGYYKNDDRDPPNEEESNENVVQTAQREAKNALSFINFGSFSWDLKRRITTNSPFDKDGNECKNDFGKLFSVKGE